MSFNHKTTGTSGGNIEIPFAFCEIAFNKKYTHGYRMDKLIEKESYALFIERFYFYQSYDIICMRINLSNPCTELRAYKSSLLDKDTFSPLRRLSSPWEISGQATWTASLDAQRKPIPLSQTLGFVRKTCPEDYSAPPRVIKPGKTSTRSLPFA